MQKIVKKLKLIFILLVGLCVWSFVAQAQQGDDVEALYDQFEQSAPPVEAAEGILSDTGVSAGDASSKAVGVPGRVTDLDEPDSFQDIIVLQRRFLPKTRRFEISVLGQMDVDNTFAISLGPEARLAGYFLEGHGVELHYNRMFQPFRRQMGKALNEMSLSIRRYSPRQSFGAAYKWQPFYGKMAWFDEKIIPFDFYFLLGWAMATREQHETYVNTAKEASDYVVQQKAQIISFGLGQLLVFGKSWGLRWDLAHGRLLTASCSVANQAIARNLVGTPQDPSSKCGGTFSEGGWTLSVGMSYFFPKAKYR